MSLIVLFILSVLLCSVVSIDEQGQALLSWKNSLGANEPLASWNPLDLDPCKWLGVECDSNSRVTRLVLKSLDLEGSLPSNLHSFTSLNTLIITLTNLTGPIPTELCFLPSLQTLSLSSNALVGEIPACIGNLSRTLVHLTLYDNQLSGEIPPSIGMLSKLQIFRAGGNQNLGGEIPTQIANCTNLLVLGLAETSISGTLPTSISSLQNIHTIAIYTTLLSGPIPQEIGNCSQLRNLYLYQNSISGSIPTRIGELQNLHTLLLWQNSMVGIIPSELGSCKDLAVIDLSQNSLAGSIPASFGNLLALEELQLSMNHLSGVIPSDLLNCTALTHLELDNNVLSGEIPEGIGHRLRNLSLLFAWQNELTGHIPDSLADSRNLEALDLSYNRLSGPIPKRIFGLTNLTKLLLLSNHLSGFIPPEVGNCTNLYRFRVNDNMLSGVIPAEMGKLTKLNFLDMSNNKLVGDIPPHISQCANLEFLDIHSNGLTGPLPDTLPTSLQLVDVSDNRLAGSLSPNLGSLRELTKLNLGRNHFSGRIPSELVSCTKLELLNMGDNLLSGNIPKEVGLLPALGISLNLSCNQLSGEIPFHFSRLDKLGILDMSHNQLSGNVNMLASLENLLVLNISYNNLSGELPNTPLFRKLPFTGNPALYLPIEGGVDHMTARKKSSAKLAIYLVISLSVVLVVLALYVLVCTHLDTRRQHDNRWEMTLYQKLEFSVDDVVHHLTSSNVIGTGSSGVVYKVPIPNGATLAVKKMWSSEDESGAFESEIRTLGSVRHKNIVRLLGWCSKGNMKLLLYDYHSNGSLSGLLHGVGVKGAAAASEWESRYDIALGVAHALSYLHHDCLPAIIHGDVKAMNVLLGPRFEPYLADFGLARRVNMPPPPQPAGSYGYMAPEHASTKMITEKSDVYSFGVLLLQVLTGRHPLDPTLPGGGANLVEWARGQLPENTLDSKLNLDDSQTMHEMLQTLAVSFLCTNARADQRPIMKDVVAMLKEIRPRIDPAAHNSLCKIASSATVSPLDLQASSSNCSFAFSDDYLPTQQLQI